MNVDTIGLEGEQRSDLTLRDAFVPLFELVAPYMDDSGNWRSSLHEVQAHQALAEHFPDITGMRLFAVLARIGKLKSDGRTPT